MRGRLPAQFPGISKVLRRLCDQYGVLLILMVATGWSPEYVAWIKRKFAQICWCWKKGDLRIFSACRDSPAVKSMQDSALQPLHLPLSVARLSWAMQYTVLWRVWIYC